MAAFAFTKIEVKDIGQAEQFYTNALGLEVRTRLAFGTGADHMSEVIMGAPGSRYPAPDLILISRSHADCPTPGEATTGFLVESLEATIDKAVEAGATIEIPITTVAEHHLRLAYIRDPQGHRIEVMQRLAD